ncbi:MAG TPA: SRPBCC family protein [bacterium]|nr:SRPBCC family protein [bacterium]
MTAPPDPDAVRRKVCIAASPGTVFEFLTDAAKLVRWAGTEAISDARLGGAYRTAINPGHIISGDYVEVVRNSRVVFTWGWVDSRGIPPGSSLVEIVLSPDGVGTRLTLTHTGLPEPVRDGHGEVWDHYLPRLALAAAGGDPGPDPWAAPERM